jgi:hypothetical protein
MKKTYIAIIVLVLVLAGGYYVVKMKKDTAPVPEPQPVACTLDARICPDGSAVGRTGPNCEFAPCPDIKPKPKPETATEGSVGVGETKNINGVSVTLNKIVEDSRCPSDVQCIWAGRLVANVTLETGGNTETLDLASDTPKAFGTFLVSITNISPEKLSSNPSASYKITFKVENKQ